jgi:RimJ/RimL family protein N-acetyltransferase
MVDVEAIETERLVLRAYTDADAPRVLAIHSRLDVIRWLGNPPYVPMATLDQAHDWIARTHRNVEVDPFHRTYAVEVKATGVVAGSSQVSRVSLLGQEWDGEYEVGWHLHPDSAGHGYATEAAAAVLDDAFERGLEQVWCGMFAHNEPSARVALKLGLHELGYGPDPWYGGEGRLFEATREWWLARRAVT